MDTNLVEVHIHALELEVRRAVVAALHQSKFRRKRYCNLHSIAIETVFARDLLPIER